MLRLQVSPAAKLEDQYLPVAKGMSAACFISIFLTTGSRRHASPACARSGTCRRLALPFNQLPAARIHSVQSHCFPWCRVGILPGVILSCRTRASFCFNLLSKFQVVASRLHCRGCLDGRRKLPVHARHIVTWSYKGLSLFHHGLDRFSFVFHVCSGPYPCCLSSRTALL